MILTWTFFSKENGVLSKENRTLDLRFQELSRSYEECRVALVERGKVNESLAGERGSLVIQLHWAQCNSVLVWLSSEWYRSVLMLPDNHSHCVLLNFSMYSHFSLTHALSLSLTHTHSAWARDIAGSDQGTRRGCSCRDETETNRGAQISLSNQTSHPHWLTEWDRKRESVSQCSCTSQWLSLILYYLRFPSSLAHSSSHPSSSSPALLYSALSVDQSGTSSLQGPGVEGERESPIRN